MLKRNKAQHQTLQLLMSDGAMEVDPAARKVGSQLVSDILNGIAMPGRQMPTPTYVHRELNRTPIQQDGVHFETVNPAPVERDSEFLNSDAAAMWDGARLDLDSEVDESRRFHTWLQALVVVVSVLFLVFAGFAYSHSNELKSQAEEEGQQNAPGATAPTPTPLPPILPRVGGN